MAQKGLEFSQGYRFTDGGKRTAVLDPNGKLNLIDDLGSLEIIENWKAYVKDVMEDTPAKGEENILNQLGMLLGTWEPIPEDSAPSPKKVVSKYSEPTATDLGEDKKVMATATAVKKTVAKTAAPKKDKVESVCPCGCEGLTFSKFCPGHDARVHGWQKKIERGDMKFSEISPTAAAFLKKQGVKQGVKSAAA